MEVSFNLDALEITVRLNDLHFAEIPFTVGRIVSVDGRSNHHTQKAEKIIKIILSQVLGHYSAFANSCPLQTDTFVFPLIHSHNVILSSNKF